MGEIFRPEDVVKGRRRMIRDMVRDLSPGVRDVVVEILESWEGATSEKKLVSILGNKGATRLLNRIREFPK